MLEQLFGSRTRVKLLRLFLTNPEVEFFVREITRKVDERINSVRRELANLEHLTLIETSAKNKKRFYRLNRKCILYPELKALILKSRVTIEEDVLQKLRRSGGIKYLSLTGIFTGVGEAKTDVLLVGRANRKLLHTLIKKLQSNFEQDIRFTVMTPAEFAYRRDITDRFLYTILENKQVVLINALKKAVEEEKAVS